MNVDPRAIMAASNNADLYAAVFSAHGLDFARKPYGFIGQGRPPPYYSNLSVSLPGHADEVTAELRALSEKFVAGIGVKDSFCELALEGNGFEVLFGASWIWRGPGRDEVPGWIRINRAAGLQRWEAAWKQSGSPTPHTMFPAALLERADTVFLGHVVDGAILAGCIASLSDDCVGISNVFSVSNSSEVFAQATAAVSGLAPDSPIVGYESGDDLNHARDAGFLPVGDLRILVARKARF
ncbi:hypothetical protein ABWH89_12175 [Hoeflea alexandrii]|uniref:hypothetical protein n=1 Tax=Hoeflea alexandrii TaxID=288436 RepID=UPI0035CF4D6F